MRLFVILITVFLLGCGGHSNTWHKRGSLVIVSLSTNGLVAVSDRKVTISNDLGESRVIDPITKIHPINNYYAFALTGQMETTWRRSSCFNPVTLIKQHFTNRPLVSLDSSSVLGLVPTLLEGFQAFDNARQRNLIAIEEVPFS